VRTPFTKKSVETLHVIKLQSVQWGVVGYLPAVASEVVLVFGVLSEEQGARFGLVCVCSVVRVLVLSPGGGVGSCVCSVVPPPPAAPITGAAFGNNPTVLLSNEARPLVR